MNKVILTLILSFVLFSGGIFAQSSYNVNIELHRELNKIGNTTTVLSIFVQGDLTKISAAARVNEGNYLYGYGDIARVDIPANKVRTFLDNEGIVKAEYHNSKAVLMNDFMLETNNIDSVHAGLGTLPMPLKGKDVIVGVIDAGLEFKHDDFRDPVTDESRILHMWDQLLTCGSPPQGYTYGCEIAGSSFDAPPYPAHDPDVEYAHGTRVASLAVGNGSSVSPVPKYVGGAPESDIVFVNINFNNFEASFVDAVRYIFLKATALGRPCVINSSVGGYTGAHDARDLATLLLINIINGSSGRTLIQAGGNAGNSFQHLSYPVTADTSFTWFRYSTPVGGIEFPIYAFRPDFDNVNFGFAARDRFTNFYYGNTPFHNISEMNLSPSHPLDSIVETLYHNGQLIGTIRYYGKYEGDSYYMLCHITATEYYDHWEFQTTGSGQFHVWSHRTEIGNSRMMEPGNVPTPDTMPVMANYQFPDKEYTIVGKWGCHEEIITIGNYNNSAYSLTFNPDTLWNTLATGEVQPRGSLVFRSSKGPTRLGVIKPDLAATGNHTMAATSMTRLAHHACCEQGILAPEGKHIVMGGTSGSAPVVSGAVACYLELFPDATNVEIRDALKNSAKVDTFVVGWYPPVPSNFWGAGKLDGYQLIAQAITYGCTDPNSPNYDPNATIDDGTCIMSSNEGILMDQPYLLVKPNPFTDHTLVEFHVTNSPTALTTELALYDVAGKLLYQQPITEASGSLHFDGAGLSPGMYIWKLSQNGAEVLQRKVVVIR